MDMTAENSIDAVTFSVTHNSAFELANEINGVFDPLLRLGT